MGKKTQEVNKERLVAIEAHSKWAKEQQLKVLAFMRYANNCFAYVPLPPEAPKGVVLPGVVSKAVGFDHSWKVSSIVLVPPFIEKALTIPAGHTHLLHTVDHNVPVLLGALLSGVKKLVELADEVEITTPDCKAKLMNKDGVWDVMEEETADGIEGSSV